jgi:uncharacterized protein (DUF1501 family)
MKEHPLKALIAAHLLGGNTGLSLKGDMTDQVVKSMVGVAMRVATEIETQVAESIAESECLVVAHLLGGTKGLSLSPAMTDKEIEGMVGVAVRVLKEMDRQAKQTEVSR